MLRLVLFLILSTSIFAAPKKEKSINDYLKGYTKLPGFLNIYQKENKYYLLLSTKDFKKDFLMTASVAKGVGTGGIFGGTLLRTKIVKFKKSNKQVQFLFRNAWHKSTKDKQLAKAVKVAFHDEIASVMPVVKDKGGKTLVNASSFLASDFYGLSDALQRIKGGVLMFNSKLSHVDSIKNFRSNTEFRTALAFMQRTRTGTTRNFEVLVHYSMFPFPKNKYRPRDADQRVGYFQTVLKDYSKPEDQDVFVHYIKRWNLEKAEPKAKTSLPKKPIIYYLSKNVPLRYRKYVRAGVLEWNKAFEKIGFIGAVEARIQTDEETWDPENNDYHTISWITTDKASYGAIGPSRMNPLTGEILDADILFDESRLRGAAFKFAARFGRESERMESPEEQNQLLEELLPHEHERCNIYELVGNQLGLILLSSNNMLKVKNPKSKNKNETDEENGNEEEKTEKNGEEKKNGETNGNGNGNGKKKETPLNLLKEEYIGQAIKWIIMHEVGHTLGLRHNFKGSTLHENDKLHDKELIAKMGLYNSVMDYPGVNISKEPEKQGYYYTPTLGAYDYWAIKYGYSHFPKKESNELKKIASQAGKHEYAYATDEDARGFHFSEVDPYANVYDLGKDPMLYASNLIDYIGNSWDKIVDRVTPEGRNYDYVEKVYFNLVNQYAMGLDFISKFVGGKEYLRIHRGDAKRNPLTPIPFKKQRQALELLKKLAFTEEHLKIPAELAECMPSTRWSNWGKNRVWGKALDKVTYRVHTWVMAKPLDRLLSPKVLSRIVEQQSLYGDKEDVITIEDVFDTLSTGIFSELYKDEKGDYKESKPFISAAKRNLQRVYINELMRLTNNRIKNGEKSPYEALTMARYALKRILYRIDHFYKEPVYKKLDSMTKIHLDDCFNRLKHFMDSKYLITNY
jgi:hypothetical protein